MKELSQLNVEPRVTIESEGTYVELTLPSPCHLCDEPRVLGVRWNVQRDQLMISLAALAEIATQVIPLKRNVVSVIGQIYDPLGFLSRYYPVQETDAESMQGQVGMGSGTAGKAAGGVEQACLELGRECTDCSTQMLF